MRTILKIGLVLSIGVQGLILMVGCGRSDTKDIQNPGTTVVRFSSFETKSAYTDLSQTLKGPLFATSFTQQSASSDVLSQIIIYAISQDAASPYIDTIRLENESDSSGSAQFSLPNGLYKFYAMGYPAGSGIVSTVNTYRKCGVIGPVSLNGTDLTLDLRISMNQCLVNTDFTNPLFKNTGFLVAMRFALYSCANTAAFPVATTNCGGFCADCTGSPGSIQSFKIKLLAYKSTGNGFVEKPDAHITSCIQSGSPPGFYTPSPIDLPVGIALSANKPNFRVEIETDVSSTSCNSAGTGSGKKLTFDSMIFPAHGIEYSIGGAVVKLLPDDLSNGDANLYFDH